MVWPKSPHLDPQNPPPPKGGLQPTVGVQNRGVAPGPRAFYFSCLPLARWRGRGIGCTWRLFKEEGSQQQGTCTWIAGPMALSTRRPIALAQCCLLSATLQRE